VKFQIMSVLLALASGKMMQLNGFVASMKSVECEPCRMLREV